MYFYKIITEKRFWHTWKVLSEEEGGVSGEWWIGRVITGVEDGLLDDGTLVSFASLSHTVPGDQISLFRPMVDDTSFALMLRFSGASSSANNVKKNSFHYSKYSFQVQKVYFLNSYWILFFYWILFQYHLHISLSNLINNSRSKTDCFFEYIFLCKYNKNHTSKDKSSNIFQP